MSQTNSSVLVTGGAGYIGSHAVLALKRAGHNVVVLDNLSYGHRELVEEALHMELVVGDTSDRPLLDCLFATFPWWRAIVVPVIRRFWWAAATRRGTCWVGNPSMPTSTKFCVMPGNGIKSDMERTDEINDVLPDAAKA